MWWRYALLFLSFQWRCVSGKGSYTGHSLVESHQPNTKKRLQVQKKLKELKPLKSFCMSCRYCLNKQKKLLFLSIFGSSIVDFSKFISIKYGCSHYTVTFVILLSHMITFGLQIYQLAVDIYASFAIFLTFRCSLYNATYANTSAWCIINNNGNLYRVICSIIPATLKSKRIHGWKYILAHVHGTLLSGHLVCCWVVARQHDDFVICKT